MKKLSNWKDRFREGMYACPELRKRKVHRDFLSYLVFRANPNIRFCWQTQHEMARAMGCSVRNIKDLLNYLIEIGAIYSVRVKDMTKRDLGVIHQLSPEKVVSNARAYFVCEQWAEDVLNDRHAPVEEENVSFPLTPEAQSKGRKAANTSRKRYVPIDLVHEHSLAKNPEHDEWQILNAVPAEWGSATSPLKRAEWGSATTDMYLNNNPDASTAPTNGSAPSFVPPPSEANPLQSSSSPLHPRALIFQQGYGGGAAVAPDPSPAGLARPEDTSEQEAACARENDRRAS